MSIDARKIRLIMSLRRSGVTDMTVLSALERIPRELFVPEAFADQAYEDMALPIGHGQTISQPLIVALMTQTLEIRPEHKILEVGAGSGYQAAILAKLCRHVFTVERHLPLLCEAEKRFETLGLTNITTKHFDGVKGWPEEAPFDRILVTAAAGGPDPPQELLDQLGENGVLVIPLGEDRREQRVVKFRRVETGLQREDLWPVRFVPLLPDLPTENEAPARSV
ncbi:L-isoaspartate protein carboxylmethyltransferase type II [Azospirillaceae bacterium]